MQGAPKFGKVELLIKEAIHSDSIEKLTYDDCGMVITGDYLIIVEDEKENIETTKTSTGTIFNLSQVKSYKTHSK
jgi:hypothetical protein